jgi:predicted cobalt transporter CbtA
MKIKNILLIASIVITILGLSLIFIQTEIQVTLLGAILLALGMMLFVAYIVYKGQPSK